MTVPAELAKMLASLKSRSDEELKSLVAVGREAEQILDERGVQMAGKIELTEAEQAAFLKAYPATMELLSSRKPRRKGGKRRVK